MAVVALGAALMWFSGGLLAQQAPAANPTPSVPGAQAAPTEAAAEPQQPAHGITNTEAVHILVGHSAVIHTQVRFKRVLIGNPAVLSTTTTAPDEVVLTALAPGSSSLVLWQDNGQSRIIEVFADIDISLLRDSLQRAFPAENIQAEAEEGRILLTGTASSQATVEQAAKMAGQFSKEVVNSLQVQPPGRQKQILLKVRFAEVDRTKLNAFGINFLSTGAANSIGTVTTSQFGSVGLGANSLKSVIGAPVRGFSSDFAISDLLNIFIFRPDVNLGATIRDLEQKNVLQVLAEPNLMAVSGQAAQFLAGGEMPYPMVQPGAGGLSTVTVQFRPFGVKLEFTGTIESDNTIRLKVAPEVSSLDFANAVTITGFVLPAISTRRAETTVQLKDGQSFGVAGLMDQRTTAVMSKIPGIADIPILGNLFRSKSINKTHTELLVLVTPTIVDPLSAPAIPPPPAPFPPLDPKQFDKGVAPGGKEK